MAARTKGKSSFVKQAAILASAGMLVRFLGFVYRLPLTNMLGDEGNGIYGMGWAVWCWTGNPGKKENGAIRSWINPVFPILKRLWTRCTKWAQR